MTNIFLGLVHLVLQLKNKHLIFKVIISFSFIAITAAIIQQSIYPTSIYFFDFLAQKEELSYISKDLFSIPFRLFDFFVSGFIIPLNSEMTLPITTTDLWQRFFSVEFLASKRMMLFTIITLTTLTATYMIALYSFFTSKRNNIISQSILFFIGFELVLHLFYGDNPFLYSARSNLKCNIFQRKMLHGKIQAIKH